MKRQSDIELYRCALTLGIVFLHTVGFYGQEWHWLSSMFVWCVPGFIFITGYFGCRFGISKIIKLYGVCLWCFPVSMLVGKYCGNVEMPFGMALLKEAWNAFLDNWFVHAYVGLMMLAPIINAVLAPVKQSKRIEDVIAQVGPFLFFVFGWSFLSNYNCVSPFIPKAPSCNVLTLLGTYVVARLYRLCEAEEKIPQPLAWVLFIGCFIAAALKIGKFNSVVALGIVIGSFTVIRHIRLPNWLDWISTLAGPSMFSIFLLHSNGWCLQSLHAYVDCLASSGIPKVAAFFLLSLLVFFAGLLLDLPRRIIIAAAHGIYNAFFKQ